MVIKGRLTVDAPLETVWAFLQDTPRVSACMPGAEGVEEVEPDVFRGKLKARVGAVAAAFEGQVKITERVAPERIVASVKADDRALASSVTGTFVCQLKPLEAGTQLDYEVDVAIRGRLAQIGFAVVQATARKMTAQFADCLQEALSE